MLPTKLRLRRSRGESLIVIDSRLAKDLRRFVDGSAHQRIAEARETFGIWLATLAAIRDGRLDSDEQALLKAHLGPEASEKVFAFFVST